MKERKKGKEEKLAKGEEGSWGEKVERESLKGESLKGVNDRKLVFSLTSTPLSLKKTSAASPFFQTAKEGKETSGRKGSEESVCFSVGKVDCVVWNREWSEEGKASLFLSSSSSSSSSSSFSSSSSLLQLWSWTASSFSSFSSLSSLSSLHSSSSISHENPKLLASFLFSQKVSNLVFLQTNQQKKKRRLCFLVSSEEGNLFLFQILTPIEPHELFDSIDSLQLASFHSNYSSNSESSFSNNQKKQKKEKKEEKHFKFVLESKLERISKATSGKPITSLISVGDSQSSSSLFHNPNPSHFLLSTQSGTLLLVDIERDIVLVDFTNSPSNPSLNTSSNSNPTTFFSSINALSFFSENSFAAVSTFGKLLLFDLRQSNNTFTSSSLGFEEEMLLSVACQPNKKRIVTGSSEGTLSFWDFSNLSSPHFSSYQPHSSFIWQISQWQDFIFSCSEDGTLFAHNLNDTTNTLKRQMFAKSSLSANCFNYNPTMDSIVCAYDDGTVRFRNNIRETLKRITL